MIQRSIRQYSFIVWQLLKTDFLVFKQTLWDDIINVIVWLSSFIFVFAYFYPTLGMTKAFCSFVAVSFIIGESYWRIWDTSFDLLHDIEGDRKIDYYCTLPLPTYLVFLKKILAFAYKSFILVGVSCPLSVLLLWNRIQWSQFSFAKFFSIFFVISLFMGSFSIFLASLIKHVRMTRKISIRILFPLWMFGGSEFPWYNIYTQISPVIAYFMLANPILYVMEGAHAAALGQHNHLPFWICILVISVSSIVFGILGIRRFKIQLDLI